MTPWVIGVTRRQRDCVMMLLFNSS